MKNWYSIELVDAEEQHVAGQPDHGTNLRAAIKEAKLMLADKEYKDAVRALVWTGANDTVLVADISRVQS